MARGSVVSGARAPAGIRLTVAVLVVSVVVGIYGAAVELTNGIVGTLAHAKGVSLPGAIASATGSVLLAVATALLARGLARGSRIAQVLALLVIGLRGVIAVWRMFFTPNAVAGSAVELLVLGIFAGLLTVGAGRAYFSPPPLRSDDG